ncbi:unnamed protein product [Amoebophrya sp. A120]|nr:unnamed protein product [Amoebophrya sp. A120]|eukprot:GSA120T00002503001.1
MTKASSNGARTPFHPVHLLGACNQASRPDKSRFLKHPSLEKIARAQDVDIASTLAQPGGGKGVLKTVEAETALIVAAEFGNQEVLRGLLATDLAPTFLNDHTCNTHETAFMKAVAHRHTELAKLIAEHPAFNGPKNFSQQTKILKENSLMMAIQTNNKALVQFILAHPDCPSDLLSQPQRQWPFETALIKLCHGGTGHLHHSDHTFLNATNYNGLGPEVVHKRNSSGSTSTPTTLCANQSSKPSRIVDGDRSCSSSASSTTCFNRPGSSSSSSSKSSNTSSCASSNASSRYEKLVAKGNFVSEPREQEHSRAASKTETPPPESDEESETSATASATAKQAGGAALSQTSSPTTVVSGRGSSRATSKKTRSTSSKWRPARILRFFWRGNKVFFGFLRLTRAKLASPLRVRAAWKLKSNPASTDYGAESPVEDQCSSAPGESGLADCIFCQVKPEDVFVQTESTGQTALMVAAQWGHRYLCGRLLESAGGTKEAERLLQLTDSLGRTAADWARLTSNRDVMALFEQFGARAR